jgi:hypothetical protein
MALLHRENGNFSVHHGPPVHADSPHQTDSLYRAALRFVHLRFITLAGAVAPLATIVPWYPLRGRTVAIGQAITEGGKTRGAARLAPHPCGAIT